MNVRKWEEESRAELYAAIPEHMREDFVIEITEGWVFWPSRNNKGFLPGHRLIEFGNLLQKINKPYIDDYEANYVEYQGNEEE